MRQLDVVVAPDEVDIPADRDAAGPASPSSTGKDGSFCQDDRDCRPSMAAEFTVLSVMGPLDPPSYRKATVGRDRLVGEPEEGSLFATQDPKASVR